MQTLKKLLQEIITLEESLTKPIEHIRMTGFWLFIYRYAEIEQRPAESIQTIINDEGLTKILVDVMNPFSELKNRFISVTITGLISRGLTRSKGLADAVLLLREQKELSK